MLLTGIFWQTVSHTPFGGVQCMHANTAVVVAVQVGFTVGASALGGLLLIGVSWRLLFHITSAFAGVMATMLVVAMPDESPYSLSGGGGSDYNVGGGPTTAAEVSTESGRGKVSLASAVEHCRYRQMQEP